MFWFGKSKEELPVSAPKKQPATKSPQRFSGDELLRSFGFVIHSRKCSCMPEWRYGGIIYTESEALDLVEDLRSMEKEK